MEIVKSRSKIEPELVDKNEFKIIINVESRGLVIEDFARNYRILDEANINKLNKRFAQVVNNEILNTLDKSRQYNADVFGLARAIYNKYPGEFEEIKDRWDNIYQNIPVEINVEAKIRRTGMLE